MYVVECSERTLAGVRYEEHCDALSSLVTLDHEPGNNAVCGVHLVERVCEVFASVDVLFAERVSLEDKGVPFGLQSGE